MNHRINSRNLPKCIEQLAKEGYTIDIEHCKKLIRITCEGNTLRNLIPFGQTRLNEFGGGFGGEGGRLFTLGSLTNIHHRKRYAKPQKSVLSVNII